LIEFSSVRFRHPNGVEALKGIDLTIKPGGITAIVGGNGAGKTTLIKHINGLLKPSEGRVTVFGTDTREASVAQLSRRVGIVFQNPDHQLFSDSVEHEVEFALRNLGFPEEVVHRRREWALKTFDLARYRSTPPMLLSGGEKKRLCLAVVLAWDPDVLILDEPTVGQDLIQKERLQGLIRMLLTQGKTVILVSHDIEFLWPLQPRVVVMSQGRIVAQGEAAEVFLDPRVLEAASLLRPQLVDLWESLGNRPPEPFPTIYEAKEWVAQQLVG
jgi:energy-coupling factor transport system ATP-binding protein